MSYIKFHPRYRPAILSGAKTQTRRNNEPSVDVGHKVAAVDAETGRTFAVLRVHRVYQQPLGDISEHDAMHEVTCPVDGCAPHVNRLAFEREWDLIYGDGAFEIGVLMGLNVWVIEFELAMEAT